MYIFSEYVFLPSFFLTMSFKLYVTYHLEVVGPNYKPALYHLGAVVLGNDHQNSV